MLQPALGTLMFASSSRGRGNPELRVEISTPPTEDELSLALSADGQKIVFAAAAAGGERRNSGCDRLTRARLDPSAGLMGPHIRSGRQTDEPSHFSQTTRSSGLTSLGGPPLTLVEYVPGRGGAWNTSGVIVFAATDGPLRRVSEKGGESTPLTRVETPQQLNHRFPTVPA